jgi:prepilin-type N-terminal cleavage/methylation domain-containing protein
MKRLKKKFPILLNAKVTYLKQAFTLIELMIAILIISSVLII